MGEWLVENGVDVLILVVIGVVGWIQRSQISHLKVQLDNQDKIVNTARNALEMIEKALNQTKEELEKSKLEKEEEIKNAKELAREEAEKESKKIISDLSEKIDVEQTHKEKNKEKIKEITDMFVENVQSAAQILFNLMSFVPYDKRRQCFMEAEDSLIREQWLKKDLEHDPPYEYYVPRYGLLSSLADSFSNQSLGLDPQKSYGLGGEPGPGIGGKGLDSKS